MLLFYFEQLGTWTSDVQKTFQYSVDRIKIKHLILLMSFHQESTCQYFYQLCPNWNGIVPLWDQSSRHVLFFVWFTAVNPNGVFPMLAVFVCCYLLLIYLLPVVMLTVYSRLLIVCGLSWSPYFGLGSSRSLFFLRNVRKLLSWTP